MSGLNLSTVATLFRTELRMVLRDRRMVITSLVLPLLVTPLMFMASVHTIKKREKTLQGMTYRYAVAGERPEAVRAVLDRTRERLTGEGTNAAATNAFHFKEQACVEPVSALQRGEIHLILEWIPPTTTGTNAVFLVATNTVGHLGRKPADEDGGEMPVPGVPVLRLVFRADRDESAAGMGRMQQLLSETRRWERAAVLKERGFAIKPADAGVATGHDLATKKQLAGLALGRSLTVVLLLFVLTSGAVIAIDSIAGEKERGTLETLLTTGARRVDILAAKHLVILVVALFIAALQALNLLVYVGFRVVPVPPDLAAALPPWIIGLLFLLFLPVAALAANCLLLISGYARSYKEAQLYFMPAMMLGLLPAVAPFLPGVPLRSALVLVPVANLALATKEILTGAFDWPMILLAWGVTAGTAVWTMRLGARLLSAERLITATETDAAEFAGGRALFERHVWRWFAAVWAALVIISNYTGKLDIRVQIVINLVGLFFGASCLMLRRYRLNVRETLALRAPRPAVWLGVLFAVPGGILTALAVSRVANLFLPVPPKLMEEFGASVFPPGMSMASIIFFIAIMPGFFEEIAFRGLLLHGLHRRLHPAMLAVVVGISFGFFHVALFRFAPTACLGIMLAAVTLLTGSLYPAMVWHALSNAAGLLAYKFQLPETELQPICYVAGAGMLAAAFWIFYRNRTPYPGLRRVPAGRVN